MPRLFSTALHQHHGRSKLYVCMACRKSWRGPDRWQLGPDRRRLIICSPACATLLILKHPHWFKQD